MPAKNLVVGQTSVGPGPWVRIDESKERTIQVVISGTVSLDIEGSNDGVNPQPLQSGITASNGYADDEAWMFLRANVKSISAGSVSVILGEK